ncbi:MAG: hypothetical protein AAGA69_08170, partial [Pseudomonadota bacterium]
CSMVPAVKPRDDGLKDDMRCHPGKPEGRPPGSITKSSSQKRMSGSEMGPGATPGATESRAGSAKGMRASGPARDFSIFIQDYA